MALLLWFIAVVLVLWGVVELINRNVAKGVILIIVGLLVGPGGVSIFDFDGDGDGVNGAVGYVSAVLGR